jgi:hypothetical protein
MKRHAISATLTVLTLAIFLLPASVLAQDTSGVTGAGSGAFPSGAAFSGVSLNSLKFGIGIFISNDGSATGQFQTTLVGVSALGQPQNIELEGSASVGSFNADGSGTFSGTVSLDMGNGTPPITGVPFTATVTRTSVLLTIESTALPAAGVTAGSITLTVQ